jgi:hypothetical protein
MTILLPEKFQAQRLQGTMKIFLSDLQRKKEEHEWRLFITLTIQLVWTVS